MSVLFATLSSLKREEEHAIMVALFDAEQLMGRQPRPTAGCSICSMGVGVKFPHLFLDATNTARNKYPSLRPVLAVDRVCHFRQVATSFG